MTGWDRCYAIYTQTGLLPCLRIPNGRKYWVKCRTNTPQSHSTLVVNGWHLECHSTEGCVAFAYCSIIYSAIPGLLLQMGLIINTPPPFQQS